MQINHSTKAQSFAVVDKPDERPRGWVGITDFSLEPDGTLPAANLLDDPTITLYNLDLDERLGVFVQTPSNVDLGHVPFYYATQFEQATRIMTLPFDDMIELAQSVSLDDGRMVFIHSVGRSGSTLASQLFAQAEGAVNISEPEALTWLVVARSRGIAPDAYMRALTDATMRLLCKVPAQSVWAVKGRSFWIELADWLDELYPQAKSLFLYRDAESWLASSMRAYFKERPRTAAEIADYRDYLIDILTPVSQLLARYDDKRSISMTGAIAFMWLSVMDSYLQLQDQGIRMLPIRYERWQEDPRATAEIMLRYGGVNPTTVREFEETLARDSQEGSRFSRSAVSHHDSSMQPAAYHPVSRFCCARHVAHSFQRSSIILD